ncbi:TPA: hypothetical protein PB378_002765 [Staphylococcus aureus]|uniref:hypothetical protein n=1 Tax=Staphylococcus aureus TaxID=1280 RepID=UPI0015789EA8|nr:hypothetical protein [Staphylococcus aureus]MBB2534443.1 hypothetical protein [Staphylococcus aureus]CAC8081244.1 Uncharacterised protein [Staphylococcus aureus]HDD7598746.1 hypothetical protein [Staphylococcus aureus]HDE0230141.1 hypothetical protein [Staphylococcus aureus]HDE0243782.1 hypothetical protein [Staphylococcus aureus]
MYYKVKSYNNPTLIDEATELNDVIEILTKSEITNIDRNLSFDEKIQLGAYEWLNILYQMYKNSSCYTAEEFREAYNNISCIDERDKIEIYANTNRNNVIYYNSEERSDVLLEIKKLKCLTVIKETLKSEELTTHSLANDIAVVENKSQKEYKNLNVIYDKITDRMIKCKGNIYFVGIENDEIKCLTDEQIQYINKYIQKDTLPKNFLDRMG